MADSGDVTFLQLADMRLEVRRIPGAANRAPLLFLHEGLGSVEAWGGFPGRLAEATGRAAVLYSRRGHGRSSPLAGPREVDYLHHEALEVLPQVIGELGLEKPILFGHSDGASIALLFAAAYPSAARALILEAPHVFVEEITVRGVARMGAAATATELLPRLGRYHDRVEGIFWAWHDLWTAEHFRDWRIDGLERITAPTLLVQGTDDEYGSLDQIDHIAARVSGPVERLVIEDCGHSPHREAGRRVLEESMRFIAAQGL